MLDGKSSPSIHYFLDVKVLAILRGLETKNEMTELLTQPLLTLTALQTATSTSSTTLKKNGAAPRSNQKGDRSWPK